MTASTEDVTQEIPTNVPTDMPTEEMPVVAADTARDDGHSPRKRSTPPRSPVRRVAGWIGGLVVLAAVALALSITVVPAVVGGRTLTVLSGSMSPTIPAGSVVVTKPVDPASLHVGDVITFSSRGPDALGSSHRVTHRIVAVDRTAESVSFTTRGDANEAVDAQPVVADDVIGKVWFHLPWLGWAHGRLPQIMLLGGGAVLLIIGVGALRSALRPSIETGDNG
ncbi:signal peptidase [Halopolyspora algeriensis]|uniref:Signal peptidase I n=1 Tax=Halopolyspora algeriensis TaxID=1500506 RepID=A0A368W026_9ACTN|nr:signal peptidase I [Halopolyspora algeriensis]RCW45264.1 signal peptidase [Halopolyspora algeriensis]TQM53017.1 signal peptidase [Halopolyspora algeriensis]